MGQLSHIFIGSSTLPPKGNCPPVRGGAAHKQVFAPAAHKAALRQMHCSGAGRGHPDAKDSQSDVTKSVSKPFGTPSGSDRASWWQPKKSIPPPRHPMYRQISPSARYRLRKEETNPGS
eukprot:gene9088-biopygen3186